MLAGLSLCLTEVATATDYTFSSFDVPFAGATSTLASGINDSGQIVGTYSDATGQHGFVDTGGSFSALNLPFAGVVRIHANGINDNGLIVGDWVDDTGRPHGFLATPVPVPSTLGLFLFGFGSLVAFNWRRRQ